jgi:ATP-binding protein involved in chromosome partitioning
MINLVTKEHILNAILPMTDPSSGKTLEEQNSVRRIFLNEEENKAHIIIALQELNTAHQATFQKGLLKVLKLDLGIAGVKLEYTTLNQRAAGESKILAPGKNVRFLAIASGKGGVGKSTTTANLAVALGRIGKKVGVIDADIYGSSISTIMEIKERPVFGSNIIHPVVQEGVEVIGTDMLNDSKKPLMWRGPMLGKMLDHFFNDVEWSDDIEYIIVDLPPGTGDVAIDIQRIIPSCKQIIVTTPHPSAANVAVRAGHMAQELKHTMLGVIENMSYLEHAGERINVFGQGGGVLVSQELETRLLANIPLAQPEHGEYHSIFDEKDSNGQVFLELAKYVDGFFDELEA